jgi:hypothetical protein
MITIKDTDRQLVGKIIDALIPDLNTHIDKVILRIAPQMKQIISLAILGTPEIQSLNGGQLQSEFGIPDPLPRIQAILNTWLNSLLLMRNTAKRRGDKIFGGFSVKMIRADWTDVLALPEATLTSGPFILPWLEWLLIEGDRTIIRDYSVVPVFNKKGSRTGFSLMAASPHGWGVPAQYSGTTDRNFVTRAIDVVLPQIENLIIKEFNK